MTRIFHRTSFTLLLLATLLPGSSPGQPSGGTKTTPDRIVITAPPAPKKPAEPVKPAPDELIISKSAEKSVSKPTHLTTTGSLLPHTIVYHKGDVYNRGPQELPVRLVTYKGYVYAVIPINVPGHAPEVVRLGVARP